MENIQVPKDKLLATIRENRDKHAEQYAEAQTKYREKVIEVLSERLSAIEQGGKVDLTFKLPEPQNYGKSYDTAISMLEWETEDTVVLSEHDFQRYVLNQWEWAHQFAATSLSYLG